MKINLEECLIRSKPYRRRKLQKHIVWLEFKYYHAEGEDLDGCFFRPHFKCITLRLIK